MSLTIEPTFGGASISTDDSIAIGRETFQINDKRVSRKQVEVRTDGVQIICTRLGGNTSVYTHGGAEHDLVKDTPTTVPDGALLYLARDPNSGTLQHALRLTLASAAPAPAPVPSPAPARRRPAASPAAARSSRRPSSASAPPPARQRPWRRGTARRPRAPR